MKFLRFFLLLTILGGLGWGGWWWYSQRTERSNEAHIPSHQMASATQRDIESLLVIYGDVAPEVQVEVKSEVGGRIKRIHARAGDEIERGALLIEIDDSELQNERASALTEVEGARLSAEKTQRNFERAASLHEEKLISREIYENLEADLKIAQNVLERAKSRLELVEERLSKTRIHAPTEGTLLAVYIQEGQVVTGAGSVNAGTSLMLVANLGKLRVNSHVNQIDVARIHRGQTVYLTNNAIPGERMEATIDFIAPVASTRNNVKGFALEVGILETHPMLRPGMTVSVNVPLGSAPDAISVPVGAVFEDEQEGSVVWVVNEERRAEKRRVRVGLSDLFYAEIQEGLAAGETILLVRPSEVEGLQGKS